MLKKLIYLTGAPATGKSTLSENLLKKVPETHIFTYSKELLNMVNQKDDNLKSQDDLRRESGQCITLEDVNEVDRQLLGFVRTQRHAKNILIDSHAVTIERYGFRVTPFSKQMLSDLAPDVIVCLYADASVISERIKTHAAGRPLPSITQLIYHNNLQTQLASQYAFEVGASLYFLDADCSPDLLLEKLLEVTKLK